MRWCAFALAQDRRMRIDVDPRPWFEIGDGGGLSYEETLRELRRLADEYFEADVYAEFAPGRWRISQTQRTNGSPARRSTGCSSRRCARHFLRTSTSASSRTTAAC